MTEPALEFVSGKSTRAGDTWERNSKQNLGQFGHIDIKHKYSPEGKQGRLDKIHAKVSWKWNPLLPGAAGPFHIVGGNLASTQGSGSALFDSDNGRLVSSDQHVKLEGTLVLVVGGMNIDADSTMSRTTKVLCSDTSTLKK